MAPAGSFVPLEVSQQSLPSSTHCILVNKSPFCMPQAFFKLLLLCYISVALCCTVPLKVRLSFFSPFWLFQSQAYWFLKFQVFSLADYKNLWNSASWFSKPNVMGSCLPLSAPMAFLPPADSLMGLFSFWPYLSFLSSWCSLFSTFSYGEFVLSVLRSFSGSFTLMCYLIVSIGRVGLRVLLHCHLPLCVCENIFS